MTGLRQLPVANDNSLSLAGNSTMEKQSHIFTFKSCENGRGPHFLQNFIFPDIW